jgi:hypothetical protein
MPFASFPEGIWDGVSGTRATPLTRRAPDAYDYDRIIREVQATQRKILEDSINYVKTGWFSCPASIGNHSVIGLGFKPKCVALFTCKEPGIGNFVCCQGVMDYFGNQHSMTWAASSTNIKGNSSRTLAIYSVNASGVVKVSADYISMDGDGFTLNFTVVDVDFDIHWDAIG